MFVNYARILQGKFERLKKALDQTRDSPNFETAFLDYVKSHYSETDQQYFEAYCLKKKWDLPIHKLRTHQLSANAHFSNFFKQLKGLLELPGAVEASVDAGSRPGLAQQSRRRASHSFASNQLFAEGRSQRRRRQTKLKDGPELIERLAEHSDKRQKNSRLQEAHGIIPREYENSVYFVHQLGRRGSGPLQALSSHSAHQSPAPHDKRQRMRKYSQRVKANFRPVSDSRQSLNVLLRKEVFTSLKHVRDLPKVKLSNLA